jgi:hypothetical protein
MLIFSVVVYVLTITMDVSSTIKYGIDTVARYEISPIFRYVTKRYGFEISIPIQIIFEVTLIIFVIPFYIFEIFGDLRFVIAGFFIFGIFHILGYHHNQKQNPIKS